MTLAAGTPGDGGLPGDAWITIVSYASHGNNVMSGMNEDSVTFATLHLLTGPWASGKSTLVPLLASLLPDVVVFDWDVVLPGVSAASGKDAHTDPSTWGGLKEIWAAVIHSVLAGGRDVLLCGPAHPEDLGAVSAARHPIRCAYLDCGDELLAARLLARGETDAAIADELAEMEALRQSGHHPVRVEERTPEELAREVAAWVRAAGR